MRVAILIQARYNSTRLPGKVCKELNGFPLLYHIYRRMLACKEADQVIVSCDVSGDILTLCSRYGMHSWAGSEMDLLERHTQAAKVFKADAVVRVTADCLFHDPFLLDELIGTFKWNWPCNRALSNWPNRKYSEGLDAEIWSLELLEMLSRDKNCPREDFATYAIEKGYVAQMWDDSKIPLGEDIHLSIDTPEDFDRAERMLKILGNDEWWYEKTLEAYRKCS